MAAERPPEPPEATPVSVPTPGSVMLPILSLILTLFSLVLTIGSNFASSPYSQGQLLGQKIGLLGGFILLLATLLAFGFPRLRRIVLVASLVLLGLVVWLLG